MTEKEKKEMEHIAYDWLNENEFPVNDSYEIEYKESELNNFLKELKEDGYSEEDEEMIDDEDEENDQLFDDEDLEDEDSIYDDNIDDIEE